MTIWDPFAAPPAPEPKPEPRAEEQDFDDLRKPELIALAEKRDLDSTGTRAEIIARLRAAQE
jgi:hypothetical protein